MVEVMGSEKKLIGESSTVKGLEFLKYRCTGSHSVRKLGKWAQSRRVYFKLLRVKLTLSDDKVQGVGGFIEKVKVTEFEKLKQSRDQDIAWVTHMEFYVTWLKGGTQGRERNCESGTKVFGECKE